MNKLVWKDSGIPEFVQEASTVVVGMETVLKTLKANVVKIQTMIATMEAPLLSRSEQRVFYPEEIQEQFEDALDARRDGFVEVGQQVHEVVSSATLMTSSMKISKMKKDRAEWKAYVAYLNGVVVESLMQNIRNSLTTLWNYLSPERMQQVDGSPMVFLTLDLEMDNQGGDVLFTPDVNNALKRSNVRDMLITWMKEMFTMFNGMKRLDTNTGNYLVEIEEQAELRLCTCLLYTSPSPRDS